MSETANNPSVVSRQPSDDPFAPLPQAVVRTRGDFSLVWLIPLVAVVIGGWLAVKTFAERGPVITIEFKTASGLAAGQTKVKFKDVDVGQVTAIDVSADLKTVIVTAELKPGFAEFLTENTRFWVERPRVTLSGVSGLNTLLSGVFIALDPGTEGQARRDFKGLEEPPLFTTAEPGQRFILRSPTLGSLNIGSPVAYRQIQVGQVVGYALDADGQAVSIEIFVSAPHDRLVSANTRFWNASGIDFSLSAAGISVDTQSLLSVLIGGVSFDTPETIDAARLTEPQALSTAGNEPDVFHLYPSRDAAYAKTYSRKERYLLFFSGSVRGLSIGAPVMLKGIDIGRVLDIQLQFNVTDDQFQIPVLIEVEPDRIAIQGDEHLEETQMVNRLVAGGLRGQLKSGSLLTGQLYVDLDVYPEAKAEKIVAHYGGYQVIPTLPAQLEALTTKLTNILDKLETIPLDRIGRDLSETAAGANALVNAPELRRAIVELEGTLTAVRATAGQLNDRVAPELVETLRQTSVAFKSMDQTIAASSPTMIEMQRMFREISAASRSLRLLTDYLERHPEALLQGKGRTGR